MTTGTWWTIQRRLVMSNSLFDRLVGLDDLRQAGQILHAVLVAPAGLRRRAAAPRARRRRCRAAPPTRRSTPVIIMSSPKNWNWLRSRSFSSGSAGSFWFCRKFICSRTDRLALAVQRQPGVVHPVLIEVRQDLVRMQRSRRRKQHLVEMRGQPDAGRVAPSRRACCASCPRTSAAGADETARSPTGRRRRSRPRRSRRCRRPSPSRCPDAPARAASAASKNALPRLFVAHGPVNRS